MTASSAAADTVLVLDHGFVRLVDSMGDDLSIVRAARVSYDAAWRTGEDEKSDRRLLRYLYNNRHSTPFEAVTMTFEVMAPIFVLRQWHRHRTQSYNELSARYRELPSTFYVPDESIVGEQSDSNRQGRQATVRDRGSEIEAVRSHCAQAFTLYWHLLNRGWPRELARIVLPLNTYSHMFTTMNLWNFMHFLDLRTHPHAQLEIQRYALAMMSLACSVVPETMTLWAESGKQ